MRLPVLFSFLALPFLSACVEPRWDDANEDGSLVVVPPKLIELAAPHQDVSVVKLDPETYCFWYLHRGPVEDTFLPLLTRQGRPICALKPEAEAEAKPQTTS